MHMVVDELERTGQLEKAGGKAYIASLTDGAPTPLVSSTVVASARLPAGGPFRNLSGVGVSTGNSVPPDIADRDREIIERELYEKGLP